MKKPTEDYFLSYTEWFEAVTTICEIKLTKDYCLERIAALQDRKNGSTKQFIDLYGETYLEKVIGWHQKAGALN